MTSTRIFTMILNDNGCVVMSMSGQANKAINRVSCIPKRSKHGRKIKENENDLGSHF
jgi:hypothetical protein